MLPEERYSYPVLSSHEYGWRIQDSVPVSELKPPAHACTRSIQDTFYTRNGIPRAAHTLHHGLGHCGAGRGRCPWRAGHKPLIDLSGLLTLALFSLVTKKLSNAIGY